MNRTQVVVVTGGASGIGKQLANDALARGHQVMATDLDEEGLAAAATAGDWKSTGRAETRVLDVRDADAWSSVLDDCTARFGRVDTLINVAGFLDAAWVCDISDRSVDVTIDVNVKGVILGTRAAAARMTTQGTGHIINFASLAGIAPLPGNSVYCASKHAVRGFSLSAGIELRAQGVHVTVVCPGPVETPMLDIQMDREEAALTFSAKRPLTTREVSDAVFGQVFKARPLELVLPAPRSGQGTMSRLANLFPSLGLHFLDNIRSTSLRHQQATRERARRR